MERYHILEPIGEGSFGRVFKGRRRFRGQVVAMKFIPKVGQSEKALHILEREIDIMRCLKHPNIVLLLDSFETKNEIVVVTEYAEGDLFQVLGDDGSLPENQVREIACQLVSALYYLHSHRILHRDMKPQNILLGKGGVVKLCDFGFARAMSASTLVLTSIKGTPLYMSPELVEEKPYDHLTDLWSLGCILYELHTGAPPFLANSLFQLVRLIVKAPIKWPESMSQDCLSFLSGLLMKNPEKRLSWPDLLYHPFVADGVDIVSGAGSSNPLTVPPSPDVQALKQQQAAEKTTARNGQSKLLLKAIKQREKAKTSRQEITSVSAAAASGGGAPPTAHSLGSTFSVYKNSAQTSTNQYPANDNGVTRTSSAPHKGQISTDYEREFPSVEVGPRQVLKQSGPSQNHLASARMENEEDDFDYELPDFSQASVLQKLKMKLLTGQKPLSDRNGGEASAVLQRLRALRNFSESSQQADIKTLAKEMDLPHLLFTLIEEAWKLPDSVQGEMLLEELLSVLIIFLEKSPDWQLQENRAENLCQLFISLFLSRDPRRSGLLATAVLTLFTQRGVSVNVSMERLTAFLANLLTDSAEIRNPLPAGWGMCDGLLSLMLYRLSERDSLLDFESFKDSELWPCLWRHVKATLEKPDGERRLFSQNGLNVFLCFALLVFSNHPYNFLTLLSDVSPNCSFALSHLLIDTCRTSLSENGLFWEDSGIHSLSMKSCHLLCIPFSMELPLQKIQSVLKIYQKSNILANLVQMIQTLPVALVELPLCLLNRLLLSDPFHITPRLITAAQDGAFIPRRTDSPTERNKTNGTAKNHSSSIKRPEPLKPPKSKGSFTKHPSKSKKPLRVRTGQQTHLTQPSGSVEELLDSLELQDSLACYYRDLWDQRGNSLASPPDSLEIRGSGVDQQPVRTASALLAELLEGDVLSGSVTELFFLLSQLTHHLAACSTFSLLVDVELLREALRHQDDGVRAACCSFLGQVGAEVGSLQSESNPEPNWDPQLLQDLLRCLQDPAPCVRRRACKAAGSWLSKVRKAPFQNSEGLKVSSGRRVQAGEGHRDVWMLLAMAAAPSLVFLLSDVDNVIRQQCCGVLGVLALIRGVDGALLSADVPKLLLQAACDDSHHAVRRAALGALCVFSQQNSLLMALRSLGAGRKLCHKYQSLLFQKDYQWLSRLDGSAEEKL